MKTKILALTMCLAMVFSFGTTFANKKDKVTVTFKAELHCKSCKAKIEKNLPFEKGVKDLKVDMAKKTIKIVYRKDKTTEAKLIAAIEKCGVKVFGKAGVAAHKHSTCTGDCGSCKSKSCENAPAVEESCKERGSCKKKHEEEHEHEGCKGCEGHHHE